MKRVSLTIYITGYNSLYSENSNSTVKVKVTLWASLTTKSAAVAKCGENHCISMADRPLHCNVKNPVLLSVGDHKTEFHSGCRVIDITFPNIVTPEVGEIHFKNNYVAYLTVKAKFRTSETSTEPGGEIKWRTCLRRFRLMPDPHTETGSQDYFQLTKKQFTCDLINVTAVRLILQQPSPVWKDFRIDELKMYRSTEQMPRANPLPAWLMEDNTVERERKKVELERKGVPNLESLSASLQHLWALSEEVAAHQTSSTIGRYEVDGCYEINLLSYT